MIVGVPKETMAGETRVALTPDGLSRLKGVQVLVEAGAGESAGFPDAAYAAAGASIAPDAAALYGQADVVLKVRPPSPEEAGLLKEGAVLISFLYPAANAGAVKALAGRKASALAMELIPRISRAQSMDALSSQATVSGYKAVLMAAESLPKFFPMLMTAAGTVPPAKVFVIGAGVAGLQAIATARRLGAVVEAYDVRPAVKEQIESVGARFVQVPLEAGDAQDAGGYAKALGEEFYARQRVAMAKWCAASDVVITTALVPGRKAPVLVPEEAVRGISPGLVIVNQAAEQGGECALTEPGKTVVKHGVTIHGPLNLPATLAPHASQMYARNVIALLGLLIKDGRLSLDVKDEVIRGCLVVHEGRARDASPATAR